MNGKIFINLAILLLILGFVGFAVWKVASNPAELGGEIKAAPAVGSLKLTAEKAIEQEAVGAAAENGLLYVATGGSVLVFKGAEQLASHKVDEGLRSITVHKGLLYLVYRAYVEVTDTALNHLQTIAACSDNSELCAAAVVGGSIFVSDAENKNLARYGMDGTFRDFVVSPNKFVVPSLIFGLAAKGDTLLAVNPGRHEVECYTADGKFIRSFEGDFRGCCNPAFIAVDCFGSIIASEKGEQRIGSYTTDGKKLSTLAEERLLNPRGTTVKGAALAPMGTTLAVAVGKRVMWLTADSGSSFCGGCSKQGCPYRR